MSFRINWDPQKRLGKLHANGPMQQAAWWNVQTPSCCHRRSVTCKLSTFKLARFKLHKCAPLNSLASFFSYIVLILLWDSCHPGCFAATCVVYAYAAEQLMLACRLQPKLSSVSGPGLRHWIALPRSPWQRHLDLLFSPIPIYINALSVATNAARSLNCTYCV